MRRRSLADLLSRSNQTSQSDPSPQPPNSLLQVSLNYGASSGRQPSSHFARPGPRSQQQSSLDLQVDFSLTAQRNMLFGASGAGKTTLLRLLAGLLAPAQASITLKGRKLTDTAAGLAVPAGHRGIGYVTQEPALFPHLSVESNIAYGLHRLPRQARRARVSAILAAFSLDSLAQRLPLRLSGGERQRVALARALAPAPALLLLDEPFASLDAPLRGTTATALNRYLQQSETITLAVSHDVAEVYASGAEVLLLEAGRIAAQGPSRQVLAAHRERLLRQLDAQEP